MKSEPNDSEKSKNPISGKIVFAAVLVATLAVSSFLGFYSLWADQAFNIEIKNPVEARFLDGNITCFVYNLTYSVENYFPFKNYTIYPKIAKNNSNIYEPIDNTAKAFSDNKITISSFEIKTTYGDKELFSPYKIIDPRVLPVVHTPGLAKTTLIINWSYNQTTMEGGQSDSFALLLTNNPNSTATRVSGDDLLPRKSFDLLWNTLPFVVFWALGVVVSWIVFEQGKIKDAFGNLTNFDVESYQKAGNAEKKKLEDNLNEIIAFPKKEKSWNRLWFGLSMFIVKNLTSKKCKEYSEGSFKVSPYMKRSLKDIFGKYEKNTLEKIEDTLPEIKTILIFFGFLASLGLTFSFNIGAVGALIYVVILFYVFFNMGASIQFVWKSKTDRNWIIATFIIALVIVVLSSIVSVLRVLS